MNPSPETVKSGRRPLAIVEDHELVLDGLTNWFGTHAHDFEVVISASSWGALIRHPAFPPDVVVMDYQLAEPISIESRIGLCAAAGAVVVVMSAVTDQVDIDRIMAAGAARFVPKANPAADVLAAVRSALGVEDAHGLAAARFSDDEIAVLNLYADGHNPVEVALLQNSRPEAVRKILAGIRSAYATQGRPADDRETLIRRAAEDGYLR
ncbi:response regulator [Subtercola vilae]|nr:response regulator [Subtercola vilae]